jgi:hypothetical protein
MKKNIQAYEHILEMYFWKKIKKLKFEMLMVIFLKFEFWI